MVANVQRNFQKKGTEFSGAGKAVSDSAASAPLAVGQVDTGA